MGRPLTARESAVLGALLSVDFEGCESLRAEIDQVEVVAGCGCGCPSIGFRQQRGAGIRIRINAVQRGSLDGLFLYTVGDRLGGIEWIAGSEGPDPAEFPDPDRLDINPV